MLRTKCTGRTSAILLATLVMVMLSILGIVSRIDTANAAPKPAKAAGKDVSTTDDLQRSARLDTYRILGGQRPGPRREHLLL